MKKKTLLQLRKERKIKQRVILDLLNIDRKTLYNWEHCRTAPDHWQLQTLCKFYEVEKDTVIISYRRDPWSFLPPDKTYEEWKADIEAFKRDTMEWYNSTYGRTNKNQD